MRHLFEGENHESFGQFVNDAVEAYAKNKDMGKAVVEVHKSLQFFGWIAGMDGAVKIEGPKRLKKEYNEYLKSLIEE